MAQVTKTCDARESFAYCACDWGTSYMSYSPKLHWQLTDTSCHSMTFLTLVCPTDLASSHIAFDPAERRTDCPVILTGGSGLAEPTATVTPGSGTGGGSSLTNTGAGGVAVISTAGASGMAMPIAGGGLGRRCR